MKNIQILLETVIRCGGNCSGCALSSSERMTKADFDFVSFGYTSSKVNGYLKEMMKGNEIESLSVFLGQGDHFLLSDEDLTKIIEICLNLIPNEIRSKTVVLLTASAIGKHSEIKRKMDLIYNLSSELGIPMFIQTVFDPKKIKETLHFKDTYLKNILYFKEKCGMTDLTINLGSDFFETMTAQEFHYWVVENRFNHVEVNWVINKITENMWQGNIDKMSDWITSWLYTYKQNPVYEINYIPIALRLLNYKDLDLFASKSYIEDVLMENIYVDNQGNLIPCRVGPINNLTPIQERLADKKLININSLVSGKQIYDEVRKTSSILAKKAIAKTISNKVCSSCEYRTACTLSGANTWIDYKGHENKCAWNVKQLYLLLDELFFDKTFKLTAFSKNPVQNVKLMKDGNATSLWFDEEVRKRINYEK